MKRVIEALVLFVLASSAAAAGAVSIVAVTPQGEVAQVRQVTVKFSEAVVPFGDPRLPIRWRSPARAASGGQRAVGQRPRLAVRLREPLLRARFHPKVRADWKPASKASTASPAATAASAPTLTGRSLRVQHRRPGGPVVATR